MTDRGPLQRHHLRQSILTCTSCALHINTTPVPFRGPTDPSIVVIGEAPGAEEEKEGKPFVGPSGRLAARWMVQARLPYDRIAWANVVSCFPRRTPTAKEVTACSGNLDRQLAFLQPRWVILMGGVAVSRWWPKIRMGEIRGQFWQIPIPSYSTGPDMSAGPDVSHSAWAMATWHPAAVLRNKTLEQEVVADLARFRGVVENEGRDPEHPAIGYPFNSKCFVCGEWGMRWLKMDGTESYDGVGALALCDKHWLVRVEGGGKGKPLPAKRTSK